MTRMRGRGDTDFTKRKTVHNIGLIPRRRQKMKKLLRKMCGPGGGSRKEGKVHWTNRWGRLASKIPLPGVESSYKKVAER